MKAKRVSHSMGFHGSRASCPTDDALHGPLSFVHEAAFQGATGSDGIGHDDAHASWIDLAFIDSPAVNMTTDVCVHLRYEVRLLHCT